MMARKQCSTGKKMASPISFGEKNVGFKVCADKKTTNIHKHGHTPANVKMREELQFPIGEGSLLELRDEGFEVRPERNITV